MHILILILVTLFVQPLFASEIQEFTAEYEIYYGDRRLGTANYRLSHSRENIYQFEFVSELSFFIFSDERSVRSDLVYEDHHLLPVYYSHDRRGTGRDYLEEIHFDRSDKLIRSSYRKESVEFEYEEDIVDGLTVQLKMMLDLRRGVKRPKYKILDFNKIREREFSFAGDETITVQNVDYRSVIYQVVRDNDRRKTQLWFLPDRDYLPVKMAHYSKGKKKFNARLVKYKLFDEPEVSVEVESSD
jgi:hypothetical protein